MVNNGRNERNGYLAQWTPWTQWVVRLKDAKVGLDLLPHTTNQTPVRTTKKTLCPSVLPL
jgi:hypothetical protein